MNGWVKSVIAISLLAVVLLTAAWRYFVHAPLQTQAAFAALMEDVKPLLKFQNPSINIDIATSMSTLLDTPQIGETQDKRLERLAAKEKIEAAINNASRPVPDTEFQAYKARLDSLGLRFAALDHRHLKPCQSDEAYQKWGALWHWEINAKYANGYNGPFENAVAKYETQAGQYAGRPVSLSEIKSMGETVFEQTTAELERLASQVQSEFGQDLDSFAARDENYSTTSEAIISRTAPLLAGIESKFADLGDFKFGPVPAAKLQTREGFGPNFAVASYSKGDDAMVIYWTAGRYNHIYDTMLIVHEILPGHHQHIKMTKQRACGVGPISAQTSFIEGWATYAETLADERGLFSAPDQRLGWLDYRLIRAMRIIMDIARIEDDLTEVQAWKLWQEKMPQRLNDDFAREWARINKSPHHLSYIFGSQAIFEARETLRKAMGPQFNEAEFHAALLNGHHQNLMFLAERTAAQMQARQQLDYALSGTFEPAL